MIRCGHCPDRHTTVAEVRECADEQAWQERETRSIIRAEAGMSWVCSGGNPADAGWYASQVLAGRL
jgi:hypothetical protein